MIQNDIRNDIRNISATNNPRLTYAPKTKNTIKFHKIPKNLVNFKHFIAFKYSYGNLFKLQFYATLFPYRIIVINKNWDLWLIYVTLKEK